MQVSSPGTFWSGFCEQFLLLLFSLMMVCLWQQHIFRCDTVFYFFSSYLLSCDVLVIWQLGCICWLYLLFKLSHAAAAQKPYWVAWWCRGSLQFHFSSLQVIQNTSCIYKYMSNSHHISSVSLNVIKLLLCYRFLTWADLKLIVS